MRSSCSTATAASPPGTPAPSASTATPPKRSWASIFRASIRPRTSPRASPSASGRSPRPGASTRRKAAGGGRSLEPVFRIVNEQTRAAVDNQVVRVLKEGTTVGLANHTLLLAKDGTERPIDDSGAPISDGQCGIGGVVLVFRDVTERRKSEHELREAGRRKDEF